MTSSTDSNGMLAEVEAARAVGALGQDDARTCEKNQAARVFFAVFFRHQQQTELKGDLCWD